MTTERIRIVVGEGQSMRKGLLRFVLEGEGHEVVAEADSSAELARHLAVHEPDVVVLDDGIGVTAVQMAREIAPKTKVILVWPGAVVPIGGDARVEPSQVLREMGDAVRKVTGQAPPSLDTFERPDWIDKVRKDPATLRDKLTKSGGLPTRPSVTELQGKGKRVHPLGRKSSKRGRGPVAPAASASSGPVEPAAPSEPAAPNEPVVPIVEPTAPLVILPGGPSAGTGGDVPTEPILVVDTPDDENAEPRRDAVVLALPVAAAAAAVTTTPAEGTVAPLTPTSATVAASDPLATDLNRRLGTIALGGAAVASALVLALSLGGSRIPADVIRAQSPPPSVAPSEPGISPPVVEPGDPGDPGDGPGGADPDTSVVGGPGPAGGGRTSTPPGPSPGPGPGPEEPGPEEPKPEEPKPEEPSPEEPEPEEPGPPGPPSPPGDGVGKPDGTPGGGGSPSKGTKSNGPPAVHPGQGGQHGQSGQHGNAFGIHKHEDAPMPAHHHKR